MTARQTYYGLLGGLDQESPAITVPPGRAIAVVNHESVSRGYQRTEGYERFDGQPAPSAATYSTATFTAGTTAFVVGNTVTGLTSGATARVLAAPVLDSGAWNGTGVGHVALHLIVGAFVTGEAMRVGGVTFALLDEPPVEGDGNEDEDNRLYLAATRLYARNLIEEVPGAGPVRGVLWHDGKLNAWRDNAGETAGVLHQSGASGWVQPDLGFLLAFTSGGAHEIVDGEVITGATSGATATVRYVATDAGTQWSAGSATGTLVLDNVVGVFVAEDLNVPGFPNSATITAAPAAAIFPNGGRYESVVYNFYGSSGFERAYLANGVGKAFEFDGDSIVPISTGMPDDRPFQIAAHKNHLFMAFPQGSLQHSDLGEPRSFTAVLGAAELGMGHEITNLIPNASSAFLITTDKSVAVLTGNDSSDWLLEVLAEDDAGAKAHTAQRIGQIIYLDNRGVRSAAATSTYGNFKLATYTSLIQKELDSKRRAGVLPVGSCVIKAKDQYLLFFDNGTGISIYFGRKNPEPMLFEYPFVVSCDPEVAEVDGSERVFVGATDGFVYELNVGTSFDGEEIEAFIQLPFGHQGAPRVLKRYHKAVVELVAARETTLSVVAEFDYSGALQPYAHEEVFGVQGMGGLWSVASWGEFVWDSQIVAQAETYIQGMGSNMSLIIFTASALQDSYILQGITVLFSERGQKR